MPYLPVPAAGWIFVSSFYRRISFTQESSLSSAKIRSSLVSLIGSDHFVIKYRQLNALAGASQQNNLTNVNISEACHLGFRTTALDLLPTIAQHEL